MNYWEKKITSLHSYTNDVSENLIEMKRVIVPLEGNDWSWDILVRHCPSSRRANVISSRVTHADRTAPSIKRRKSCPRRRHRRRRGDPHGGKNRRNVLYGSKNSTGKEQRGGSGAPEFLPRLPLFSLLFQPVPFFFFFFYRFLSLAISH